MLQEAEPRDTRYGLLPTPPLPKDGHKVDLTDNAREVFLRRYVRRGRDGKLLETVEETFWRVAYHVAKAEEAWNQEVLPSARNFYDLLSTGCFFPNSPTFTGAGTPLGQLAACFVLPVNDDMGRDSAGIFQTLRDAALIQQTGGGNGFAFSRLRPRGTLVKSSAGQATGPVGFLRVYDKAFGEIAQGGCLIPEMLVFTSKGLLRLDELVDASQTGWQKHDLQVFTDEGKRYSPHAFNNGLVPVLRVNTKQGLTITGTPNHKVKVIGHNGPVWRRLDELQAGDAIIVMLGQQQGKLQALQRPGKAHGNQQMPQLPPVLDEPLAFLLGYLAGDGFIARGEGDHRVGFSVGCDSYLLEDLPVLIDQVFRGCTIHSQQKPGDASVTYIIDNRAAKDFLAMNGFDKPSSSETTIPRLVRQSPPEIVGPYLRGLFEADGALSHGYPQLTTTSYRLAQEVATLLIGLGCPVSIRKISESQRMGSKPQWVVRLRSHVALENWRKYIGCDPKSRFAVCYDFKPDLDREESYLLVPADFWLEPALDAITLPQRDRKGRSKGIKFTAIDPLLRRKLLRYLHGERQLTLSGYEKLRSEHPEFASHARNVDNLWFVTVTTIESAGESLTLDLEVEGNHTYLANGMVTHNTRRGANMAVLRVDHPDIEDFISCKTDENAITNFNISVGVTDAFMVAVQRDDMWELRFPVVSSPEYSGFSGTLEQAEENGLPVKVHKRVRARDLFEKIVRQAHHNGEPGMLFLDAANRSNPVPHLYRLEATNPCGEQWLGPYENCCLGSVNLAQHCGPDGTVDWEKLRESVVLSTRFLEDVVQGNAYVPAVPQLKEAAFRARRIGLGIMGLADLMYHTGIRYGSEEGQEFAAQVMEFVRYHTMLTSIELAKERGPFEAIDGSIYDPKKIRWEPPKPINEYTSDWGRPAVNWDLVLEGIHKHGIRNAAQTTIAPTGTIATVAGCEGYGCEPVFALAYIRHMDDNGKDLQLTYTSPLFEDALIAAGIDEESRKSIVEHVMAQGTCQDLQDVPEHIRHTFVVSQDISAEEHVRMQAAMQAFVDNSLSKTINFPANATEEDVATAYQLAWQLGCKGITVYVTGTRHKVVLETQATAKEKQPEVRATEARAQQLTIWHVKKKPRPRQLKGYTYKVDTPLGKAFVTVNENGEEQPFEVFVNTAKAGSDTAAVSEAIGRLSSYILRLDSPVAPRERLKEIIRQLSGIGGGRSLGFGPNRVRSLPDGVAQALEEYLQDSVEEGREQSAGIRGNGYLSQAELPGEQPLFQVGDLCPECGQAALVYEEGCRKCYACAYSEC